jgi:glycosyltransferase involved in cell wall biosynthesis
MRVKLINASIILLAYNQQQFIKEALNSLVNQDLDNLETVISDDNSTDQISLAKKFRYFQLSSLSYFHRSIMRFNELIGR